MNVYFNFQFLQETLFAPELCLGEHSAAIEHNAFFSEILVLSTQDHLIVHVV